jgi:hypothetical protein
MTVIPYIPLIYHIPLSLLLNQMTEASDSMLFRQKLYDNFKESGLLAKLKTSLRADLLQKLEKPAPMTIPNEPS